MDPFIQFPLNSQSLNPYSYILNNPLSGTDPTGYAACTGSHIQNSGGVDCATTTGARIDGPMQFAPDKKSTASGGNGAPNRQSPTGASGRKDNAAQASDKGSDDNKSGFETASEILTGIFTPNFDDWQKRGEPADSVTDNISGIAKWGVNAGVGLANAVVRAKSGNPMAPPAFPSLRLDSKELEVAATLDILTLVGSAFARSAGGRVQELDTVVVTVRKSDGVGLSLQPTKNANGGVDFSGHADLYPTQPGQQNIVRIQYTGSRRQDFGAANQAGGIGATQKPPGGYTWHHLDDYDPATNSGTMQLIKRESHEATYPHNGGVRQYEQATGIKYK